MKNKINKEIRKDLKKTIGIFMLASLAIIIPSTFINRTLFKSEDNVIYKDGYIIKIKNNNKILWDSNNNGNDKQ